MKRVVPILLALAALQACGDLTETETQARVRFRPAGDPAAASADVVAFDVAASTAGALHVQFLDRPGPLRSDGAPPRPDETGHAGSSWSSKVHVESGMTTLVFQVDGGAGPHASGFRLHVGDAQAGDPGEIGIPNRPKAIHELRVAAGCAVDTESGYVEIAAGEPLVLHYWVFGDAEEDVSAAADAQGTPVLRVGGRPVPLPEHDAPVWVLRTWFVPR